MSALTPHLLRGLAGPARRLLVPRAHIHSKPPREQLGTMVRSGRPGPGGFGAAGPAHCTSRLAAWGPRCCFGRVWRAQGTVPGPRWFSQPQDLGSQPVSRFTGVSDDCTRYRYSFLGEGRTGGPQ